jgi:diguanylate cyclase (GGDEF)-like protein/PAS domain S-box-containing protein
VKFTARLPMKGVEGIPMTDRTELLEAALDSLPDGIGLAGQQGRLAFWNKAAEGITGHPRAELLGRPVRELLDLLIVGGSGQWINQTDAELSSGHGVLIHVHHRLGHEFPTMARVLVLRDSLGGRIGTGIAFHPAECLDALPHGTSSEDSLVEESQAKLEDRLEAEYNDFLQGGTPFGVLWITVDQAHHMRETHGARACEAMLEIVERTLANALRPTEKIGRWGDDEFLVISHERSHEMLAAHAQLLTELARTADFRWWGDRVLLSASIGAAQAEVDQTLAQLLERAKAGMNSNIRVDENQIKSAAGEQPCLP